jgi:hypothetical protein
MYRSGKTLILAALCFAVFLTLMPSALALAQKPAWVTATARTSAAATTAEEGLTEVTSGAVVVVNNSHVVTALIIAGSFIVLGLITAHAYVEGKSVESLYKSLPPGAQRLSEIVLEQLINRAAQTPGDADDLALEQLAHKLGYNQSALEDGRIILTPRGSLG